MVQCSQCGKETNNPKFCSQTCSALFNNTLRYAKLEKIISYCKKCNNPCAKNRKFCNDCYVVRGAFAEDMTLEQARYKRGSQTNAHTLVRFRARDFALNVLKWDKCQKCGYDKHIEIAHKKAITEFDDNTLLSEINKEENLMALCPNCHWEYDHPNCSIKVGRHGKEEKTKECPICTKLICNESMACKYCANKFLRTKIDWPPLKELVQMVEESNLTQVGKKLGVSANAIKKHIKNLVMDNANQK